MIRSLLQRSEPSGDDARELRDALEESQAAKKLATAERDEAEKARHLAETERDEAIRREQALKVELDAMRERSKHGESPLVAASSSRERQLQGELRALKERLRDAHKTDERIRRLESRNARLKLQLSHRRWGPIDRLEQVVWDNWQVPTALSVAGLMLAWFFDKPTIPSPLVGFAILTLVTTIVTLVRRR
ncbi:MAG: hypothetical protein JNG84_13135 [Archangium sp.]|nr:hypothetical protein [Archangium sp.]